MGLFHKAKRESKIILPKDARCDACGKKIRSDEKILYADGKLYCERCARAKEDRECLEFTAMIED